MGGGWVMGTIPARVLARIQAELVLHANDLRTEVIDTLSHPGTGRIYRLGRTNEHQASAPNNPPAVDTGNLRQSIGIDTSQLSKLKVSVGVTKAAPYAVFLEFGTATMAPRRFLLPSVLQYRSKVGKK